MQRVGDATTTISWTHHWNCFLKMLFLQAVRESHLYEVTRTLGRALFASAGA